MHNCILRLKKTIHYPSIATIMSKSDNNINKRSRSRLTSQSPITTMNSNGIELQDNENGYLNKTNKIAFFSHVYSQ